MSEKLKTKFVLFTKTAPEEVEQYIKLTGGAYNYFDTPAEFYEDIETGLRETRRLASEARKKGVPVESLIKQNLKDVPITYALINERDGKILGVGCIKNHEYILSRAKQADQKDLVKEIESNPTSWGCLEYVCVDDRFRGQQLGKKTVEGLFVEADKLGLKNKALFCAENEFGFYKRAGMEFGCLVEDGGVLRTKIGKLCDETQRQKIVTDGVTFGQVMDFLDGYEKKMDAFRDEKIASLGSFPPKAEIDAVHDEYPEVTYPAKAPTGLMIRRKLMTRTP